jgi:hypothetical protein
VCGPKCSFGGGRHACRGCYFGLRCIFCSNRGGTHFTEEQNVIHKLCW